MESLYTVEASIHKVTHEEVISFWALTTYLEEFENVVELAVDVSADLKLVRNSFKNPLTVTGASTLWTLLSSTKISLVLAQRSFTSLSLRNWPPLRISIYLSRSWVAIF